MEFGLNFFPSCAPDERSAEDYWADALYLCGLMDELGYSHVRTVEHYFHAYGGYSPNPVVFLAAAAQRSLKAKMITGAVLPVFNNPLKLAGELGMLDAISNGRLEIGFARAFLPNEFETFGIDIEESRDRYEEGVEQVQLLLEQENATHEGRFHAFRDVTSLPRPTQKPRPPFWVAAMSTRASFEFAGRNGHYIMGIPMGGGLMAELIGVYREEWKSAGHPGDGKIMLSFSMCTDEDGAIARDAFRPPLNAYLERLVDAASGWLKGTSTKDYKGYDKMIAALKDDDFDQQMDRGICWAGSPDEIAGMIAEFNRDVGGFDIASLHVMPHVMEASVAEKSMRLFSEHVMPKFR
ncbi:MAG: alkanesulfonate monooxygenase SsuD [Paracoccaceae bacterium]|jgi:alkanesulfonate monooxygenase SsuD/methylene tetrahydromethanopterin reductase-like flavin-dependent oxidoreductase (luciferase family)